MQPALLNLAQMRDQLPQRSLLGLQYAAQAFNELSIRELTELPEIPSLHHVKSIPHGFRSSPVACSAARPCEIELFAVSSAGASPDGNQTPQMALVACIAARQH